MQLYMVVSNDIVFRRAKGTYSANVGELGHRFSMGRKGLKVCDEFILCLNPIPSPSPAIQTVTCVLFSFFCSLLVQAETEVPPCLWDFQHGARLWNGRSRSSDLCSWKWSLHKEMGKEGNGEPR